MRINVKVKHLVYGLITIGLSAYVLFSLVLPRMELNAVREQYAAGVPGSKESILAAIHHPVSTQSKWALIREYLIDGEFDGAMKRFDVYIGPGSTMVHGAEADDRLRFTWPEKQSILLDYVAEAPVDGYAYRAAQQLVAYYVGEGQADEAVAMLAFMEDRFIGEGNSWFLKEGMLEHARLLLELGRVQEAVSKLEQLKQLVSAADFDVNGRMALLEAELMIRGGALADAIRLVEQALRDYLQQWQQQMEQFGDERGTSDTEMRMHALLAQLKSAQASDSGQSVAVSGVVTRSDGTPVPNAGVFLRHASVVNRSVTSSEAYQIMTDAQGRYTFDRVLPGSYQLYLGLDFDQISGYTWPVSYDDWLDIGMNGHIQQDITLHPLMELKSPVNEAVIDEQSFTFEWYDVDGAAFYNVNIGLQLENGTVGGLLQANVTDNRLTITAEQLYDRTAGISYTEVDGRSVADPLTLLAFANPDNRFYWSVEAYDQDGRMITRSNGYRLSDNVMGNLPFFYLQERVLTDADQLLLSGEHEQALTAYKRAYQGNPKDVHSLRMIIRLLPADEDKLPYLRQMAALNPIEDYVFALAYAYYEQANWQTFLDMIAEFDLSEASYSYVSSTKGTALLKLGRYEEAIALFKQVMDSDPSHRFVGHYIAAVIYEEMKLEPAIAIAHRYPDRFMARSEQDWLSLLQQVQAEADESDLPEHYMEQLKQKLEWFFTDEHEQLQHWMRATNQAHMKKLIQAILDVN